jgi:hypothetical protein
MTERRSLDLLVSELARSHQQALDRSADELEASEERFLEALGKEKQAALSNVRERPSSGIIHWRFALASGVVVVAGVAVGVGMGVVPFGRGEGQPRAQLDISPEPAAPVRAPRAAGSSSAPTKTDQCAHPVIAAGADPVIDDFEDGDSLINPREGRGDAWMMFKDSDPPDGLPLLTPVPRKPVTARSRKALHVTDGELRD